MMGCDIHMYREKRIDGKWVTADEWSDPYGERMTVPFQKRFTDRNYNLFTVLAGVRERETPAYKFEPRGFPLVASPEVLMEIEQWGEDGHSHSYLYLHELQELADFLSTSTQKISGMKNADELDALNASIASGKPNWDLLWPYCQGTNDPKQVSFSVDVPADFIVGDSLRKIIESLEGIGGDMQRVVFFFDN